MYWFACVCTHDVRTYGLAATAVKPYVVRCGSLITNAWIVRKVKLLVNARAGPLPRATAAPVGKPDDAGEAHRPPQRWYRTYYSDGCTADQLYSNRFVDADPGICIPAKRGRQYWSQGRVTF